ncbi:MAG: DUF3341 domain-containing protein [Verrucomicrobia bacterium]|nr:MAG: DUF3341 domain-containing protein [Verrucomicrobiota bacterium]MCX6881266.1 DUF3341 domain-containing protein [Verrucomicrobiota bacterium]
MSDTPKPYALLAEFETPADVMQAARAVRIAGFRRWDVHTPFPIHGMDGAMGIKNSKVGYFSFVGGVIGLTIGMSMIWFMNKYDYPIIVGGKPLFSPLFAFPVSYELTILLASFGTLLGMCFLNRLPKLYNPIFKSQRFARASDDRFFVVIEASDPKFSATETRKLLENLGSKSIELVED